MTIPENRTIRENRDEEADLAFRQGVVRREQDRRGRDKVIPPYFPRDLMAGDPASESGIKVARSELDASLQQDLDTIENDAQVAAKRILATISLDPSGAPVLTLGAPAQAVLLDPSLFPFPSPVMAVGNASDVDGGYVAAESPLFTTPGTAAPDATAAVVETVGTIASYSLVSLIKTSDATRQRTGSGRVIFGLLQVAAGTPDGAAVASAPNQNVQVSFVSLNAGTLATELETLPAGSYYLGLPRQFEHRSRPRTASFDVETVLTDPANTAFFAGGQSPSFVEWDITAGGNIAAGDPLDVTTGVFATAGARTTAVSASGTLNHPSSGSTFRSGPELRVFVDGVLLSKGPNAGTPRQVYWVSATEIAFNFILKTGMTIYYQTPGT